MQYTPTLGTQVFVTKILENLLTVPHQSGHLDGDVIPAASLHKNILSLEVPRRPARGGAFDVGEQSHPEEEEMAAHPCSHPCLTRP